ncbi:FIBP protein, partial [Bombycilla garrulus]|nr:FIBP protein [Bombycilla garrulus]
MSSDLDVFVGNTTLIDEEVYRLWLDGHSVAEAVARRLRGGVLEREGTSVAVLQSDTRDHYRTFQMLERLLHAPPRLLQQLLFQIPPERQALLVQRYWGHWEGLGVTGTAALSPPSARPCSGLGDTGGALGKQLRGGRAQFGSFRSRFWGLGWLFGIPSVSGSPKVLGFLPYFSFSCFWVFHTGFGVSPSFPPCFWGFLPGFGVPPAPEAAEPDGDLPKSFLQDLKELKVLVTDKDLLDQHKSLVCSALRGKISVYNELEANFKALSRALVNVGGKLTHARDVRDFFVDLVEKVIEPCRSDKWSPGDLRLFLTQYTAAPRNLPGFRHQALWERYMAAITACLLRMYHD